MTNEVNWNDGEYISGSGEVEVETEVGNNISARISAIVQTVSTIRHSAR